uniref:C2H2-type domain-containing protein n=1 Tax=viral metagenome TaxID=1070528 RepID=A0A6C0KTZ6_9ZZZZ
MEKSEEYQKLYSLLTGLSSKGGSNANDGTIPQISLKELLVGKNTVTKSAVRPEIIVAPPVAPPVAKKCKATIISKPAVKLPTVLVLDIPELAKPEPFIKKEQKPKRRLIIVEEESEPVITCEACHKIFSSTLNRCRHMITSNACKKWLALPEKDRNRPLMPPIHELVDKWLHDAISRPTDNLCQFCTTIFSNKGNLHKHYQTSMVCNRLAYLSFMKLMSSLNK